MVLTDFLAELRERLAVGLGLARRIRDRRLAIGDFRSAAVTMVDRDNLADLVQFDRRGEIVPERLVPIGESRRNDADRGAGDDELTVLPDQAALRRIGMHRLLQARIDAGE